ncbi:MAG: sigma-54 dependent transcriptional regulator [Candidatus Eisenbacteria bacterium]
MNATVLIVDDDETLRRVLADRLHYWGHTVVQAEGGEAALLQAAQQSFDLILLDLSMPGMSGLEVLDGLREAGCSAERVVLTAHGSVTKAVEAMKRGADDFLTKPADFELLRAVVDRALEKRRLLRVNAALTEQVAGETPLVTGRSEPMRQLLAMASQAARSDATLLLTGESGTGKQVLAEHIHRLSPRAGGPFVYINCVAISDELIESTLFGHEKGAFTGAVARKPGRMETANGGTAFLDEVGDISPRLQTKLLHFLEAGEFERVGGTQVIRVDCRILGATNRDLPRAVKEGRFREDLFYRLNVVTLPIPPLRERREDIVPLAEAFLARYAAEMKREGLCFAGPTLDTLERYAWPGNVRQLKNAVERMVVLAQGTSLTPDLLPPEIVAGPEGEPGELWALPYREALAGFRQHLIRHALARAGGNQTRAAELLGVQRTYLNRMIKDLSISGPGSRPLES